MDRNATASGTNGSSRYGEFFISVPLFGFLGRTSDQHWCRELETPQRRAQAQSDAETLKAAVATESAAFKSLEIVRRQLQLGAISYLGLLTAQTTYQTALIALVQAQAARYADTTALFQALGGGWWNRKQGGS